MNKTQRYSDIIKGTKDKYVKVDDDFPNRDVLVTEPKKYLNDIKANKPIKYLPHYSTERKIQGVNFILTAGILENGEKATVLIKNLEFFLDIFYTVEINEIKDNGLQEFNVGQITKSDLLANVKPHMHKFIDKVDSFISLHNPARSHFVLQKIVNIGVQKYEKKLGVRVFFNKMDNKRKFLNEAYKKKSFYLASNATNVTDDYSIKRNKPMGYWVELQNYTCIISKDRKDRFRYKDVTSDKFKYEISKADYCFTVSMNDYNRTEEIPAINNNIVLTFDIETVYNPDAGFDHVESEKKSIIQPNTCIMNISMVFANAKGDTFSFNIYYMKDEKYYDIPVEGAYGISYVNEKELLLAYILVLERFQPDFVIHYNGFRFDIPMILLKTRLHNLFDIMYCRTSLFYWDNYTPDSQFEMNGFKYQYSKYGSKKYTLWKNVYTNSHCSGIIKGSDSLEGSSGLRTTKFDKDNTFKMHYWSPPGSVSYDCWIICSTLYPKEKSKSMNDFLRLLNIKSKDDVSYSEIWKYWNTTNLDGLKLVYKYCIYDSIACFKLFDKTRFLLEKRVFANKTNFNMDTVFYKAGTSKVISYIINEAYNKGYVLVEQFCNIKGEYPHLRDHRHKEKIKYGGGLVLIHKRGKICLDYLIEKDILRGRTLDDIKAEFSMYDFYEKEGNIYLIIPIPVEAVDYKSLYPSLIIEYNISPDAITTNIDQFKEGDKYHTFNEPEISDDYSTNKVYYIRDHEDDLEKFGIISGIERKLKDERIEIQEEGKRKHKAADEIRDRYKKENPIGEMSIEEYYSFINHLCEKDQKYIQFESEAISIDKYQAFQKVIMNTMYGLYAATMMPMYCYLVVFTITLMARRSLLNANKFLKSKDCILCYNDTDSSYFHHPEKQFKYIIDRFLMGEFSIRDLDKKLVHRSMKLTMTKKQLIDWYKKKGNKEKLNQLSAPNFKGFTDELNDYFLEQSRYGNLVMVREETLYPALFFNLKKYLGVVYEYKFYDNFTISNFLFKGIPIVKRDSSLFSTNFIKEIALESAKIRKADIKEIVMSKFTDIIEVLNDPNQTKYPLECFEKHQRYDPQKDNSARHTVRNMIALSEMRDDLGELCNEPNVLDFVDYVAVASYNIVDFALRKEQENKSKRYYFTKVAKKLNLQICKPDEVKTLTSTMAHFLTYRTDYEFYDPELSGKEYKNLIKKYLVKEVDSIYKSLESGIKSDKIAEHVKTLKKEQKLLYFQQIKNSHYPREVKTMLYMFYQTKKTTKILDYWKNCFENFQFMPNRILCPNKFTEINALIN